jgi:hypothetical protein
MRFHSVHVRLTVQRVKPTAAGPPRRDHGGGRRRQPQLQRHIVQSRDRWVHPVVLADPFLVLMGHKPSTTLPLWSACAPESARARGHGVSQGTDRPARDGLGPKCERWHPEGVAAVPFLRNGEGKKSPLRRLPTDHRESLTQARVSRPLTQASTSTSSYLARSRY